MQLTLAHIGARFPAKDPFEVLTQSYIQRISPYSRCEAAAFRSGDAFLDWLDRQQGRTQPILALLDSRGRQMNSEAFADWFRVRRDEGSQNLVFAIGPADGWEDAMRRRAQLLLSLGSLTLAHPLARLVMAEQLYRACTILAGHPYHTGH